MLTACPASGATHGAAQASLVIRSILKDENDGWHLRHVGDQELQIHVVLRPTGVASRVCSGYRTRKSQWSDILICRPLRDYSVQDSGTRPLR